MSRVVFRWTRYFLFSMAGLLPIHAQTNGISRSVPGQTNTQTPLVGSPVASLTPLVSPSDVTLSASQLQQFVTLNVRPKPGAPITVIWTLSPMIGLITDSGLYIAPSTIPVQQTIAVSATANGVTLATASITLLATPAAPVSPPATTTIQLPIEVAGADNTTNSVSFDLAAGADHMQAQLWMQIHGLRFEGQASVQVNNTAWIPINRSTVVLPNLANAYGGIGGGFHTLTMTMTLPIGSLTNGTNQISFRFNGTDGRVSGFRVLAFNIQSAGVSLIPASSFVQEDPNAWQAPSNTSSDIAEGQNLWRSAALTRPTAFGPLSMRAHCSDCHAQDGRDLKYFNYSNNSIRARAVFHGLTAQQGDQIASYIRTLNVPNPGRPWNPPYQPGPGLDSQPVEQWSAGAGLASVLNSDQDLLNALFPTGVQASFFSPNSVLNVRETPIALQLPDWNSWLPTIHPMDAFSDFTTSQFFTDYGQLRSALNPGDPAAYAYNISTYQLWMNHFTQYRVPKVTALDAGGWTPTVAQQMYSLLLWADVKNWELNQEFRLEGMAKAVFTHPKAEPRAWYQSFAFQTSPAMLHIPIGMAGLDNGQVNTWFYVTQIWYQLQLVLNSSEYAQTDSTPIDWPYSYSRIGNDLSNYDSAPQAGLLTLWLTKGLQISNNGIGPDVPDRGWNWSIADISREVTPSYQGIWATVPAATRTAISSGMVQGWLAEVQQFTPQQLSGGPSVPVHGWPDSPNFIDRVWYMIPQFRYFGVDQTLINQMAAWAQSIWPSTDWNTAATATCAAKDTGTIVCSTDF